MFFFPNTSQGSARWTTAVRGMWAGQPHIFWTQRRVTANEIRRREKYVVYVRNESEKCQLETLRAVGHFHSLFSCGVYPLHRGTTPSSMSSNGLGGAAFHLPYRRTHLLPRPERLIWAGVRLMWGLIIQFCFCSWFVLLWRCLCFNDLIKTTLFAQKLRIQRKRDAQFMLFWIYCVCITVADTDTVWSVGSQHWCLLWVLADCCCNFLRS